MPSVTQGDHEGHLGFPSKKRCRDEFGSVGTTHSIHNAGHGMTQPALPPDSEDLATLLDENQQPYHHRKILPVAKRLRLDDDHKAARSLHDRQPAAAASGAILSSTASTATSTATSAPASTRLSNTTPCHICHRRPQRRSDLDSLADCEGCGKRTCFVCIRECLGWPGADGLDSADTQHNTPAARGVDHPDEGGHTDNSSNNDSNNNNTGRQGQDEGTETTGSRTSRLLTTWSHGSSGHRRMICSRCCVERGQDGEVVCLGCLPFVEG